MAYNINIVNLLALQNASANLKEALDLKVPQLIDRDGISAFDNSLASNSVSCVNVLLENLAHSSQHLIQKECLMQAIQMNGNSIIEFVSKGLFTEPDFAGDLERSHLFGVLKRKKNKVTFAQ